MAPRTECSLAGVYLLMATLSILVKAPTANPLRRCPTCPEGQGLEKPCYEDESGDPGTCKPCPENYYHNPSSIRHHGYDLGGVCQACRKCETLHRMEAHGCRPEIDAECGQCLPRYYDFNGGVDGPIHAATDMACLLCRANTHAPECPRPTPTTRSEVTTPPSTTRSPAVTSQSPNVILASEASPVVSGIFYGLCVAIGCGSVSFGILFCIYKNNKGTIFGRDFCRRARELYQDSEIATPPPSTQPLLADATADSQGAPPSDVLPEGGATNRDDAPPELSQATPGEDPPMEEEVMRRSEVADARPVDRPTVPDDDLTIGATTSVVPEGHVRLSQRQVSELQGREVPAATPSPTSSRASGVEGNTAAKPVDTSAEQNKAPPNGDTSSPAVVFNTAGGDVYFSGPVIVAGGHPVRVTTGGAQVHVGDTPPGGATSVPESSDLPAEAPPVVEPCTATPVQVTSRDEPPGPLPSVTASRDEPPGPLPSASRDGTPGPLPSVTASRDGTPGPLTASRDGTPGPLPSVTAEQCGEKSEREVFNLSPDVIRESCDTYPHQETSVPGGHVITP